MRSNPYPLRDGRFLWSGEIHYFRLDPSRWEALLRAAQAAHMNAVSVYVPWNWHEPEPDRIDLTGQTHPRRNVVGFLELCERLDLPVFIRPGPTILSEWRHGGPPDWLLRGQPEVLALNASGQQPDLDMLYPPITYLHPTYLARTAAWFRSLVPLIRRHEPSVLGVQIDNELAYGWGIRCGDPLFVDYNPIVVGTTSEPGLYQRWLGERYPDIAELNERYGNRYADFADVAPPRQPPRSLGDLPWFLDWHYCKEAMANRYVETLYDLLVAEGVSAPLSMLSPYMTPYGVRRFADYFRERGKPMLITSQCYPTLYGTGGFAEEAAGHVNALAQVSRDWLAGTGDPPISAESQAAMSFHLPPGALETFYVLQLGQGIDGLNLYMAAGGDNPDGLGMNTGGSYDVSAPIGPDGSERPHYGVIERTGRFLRTHGARLRETRPLIDLAVGYYPPYETAALQGDTVRLGAHHYYDDVLSRSFGLGTGAIARGGGVYSLLTAAGYTYALVDLERTGVDSLLAHRQLWCLGLDFMAEAVQRKLVDYVRAGGDLVLLPQVPHLDERLRPCTVLSDLFPAPVAQRTSSVRAGSFRTPWHLVSVGDVRGLPVPDTVDLYDLALLPEAEPVARDERRDAVCGYAVRRGDGRATLLGFKPRYGWNAHDIHRRAIRAIVSPAITAPVAAADTGELFVSERAGRNEGFLFVVNPTRWPQAARIRYLDPFTLREAVLPRVLEGLALPDQGGLILCLRTQLTGTGVEIVYSTSQVQTWDLRGSTVHIELHGPPGSQGEIALRCDGAPRVTVQGGRPSRVTRTQGLTIVTHDHASGSTVLAVDR